MITAADIVEAELAGKFFYSSWRKVPGQLTTATVWFDLSMSSGYPAAQYYAAAPLTATALSYSENKGFYHGNNVSPAKKYLRQFSLYGINASNHPSNYFILDYLMFYSFIEDSTLEEQVMINNITLPRYDGDAHNVQMIAVNLGTRTGSQSFKVKYTNSDGVSGRETPLIAQNTASAVGSLVSSATSSATAPYQGGPFLPLQGADKGVQMVESVTMSNVDTGIFAIVLVKPIACLATFDNTAPVEIDFYTDKNSMPEIKDDAYLNLVCCPSGNISGQFLVGESKFIHI